jgi:hypothetical protein
MPIKVVGQTADRHPPAKWDSPERRKERQKEYMKKHGPPPPRRKTLAVTDKHKAVRKILKDPAGFKPLKAMQKGGRAGFKHGKFVSVASPHVDVAKYVDKQTGKELEPERGRSRIKGSEEKVIKKPRRSAGPGAAARRPKAGRQARKAMQIGGRANLLEELGRVEAEPSNRNRRAEISRVHGELNRGYAKGGRAASKEGFTVTETKKGKPHWTQEGQDASIKRKFQRASDAHQKKLKTKKEDKAKGGRIGLKHGSAQSHYMQHGYGPHKIQLRSGKPKLAKKGW